MKKTVNWIGLILTAVVLLSGIVAGYTLQQSKTEQNTADIKCLKEDNASLKEQIEQMNVQMQEIRFNLRSLCEAQHVSYIPGK